MKIDSTTCRGGRGTLLNRREFALVVAEQPGQSGVATLFALDGSE